MTHLRQRDCCPSCGSNRSREILSLAYDADPLRSFLAQYYAKMDPTYLRGEVYGLRHCESCGLIYQRGVPDEVLAQELYEHWIDGETSRKKKHLPGYWSRYRRLSEEISLAMALLGSGAGRPKVLDYGLGWGEWCKMAAAYGCETFGVELSREKVEHARAAGIKVITFEELPEGHFDYINMEQVLEHLANPGETVARLAASLRPGGLLHIAVPNGNGMLARAGNLDWSTAGRAETMAVHPLEHLNCFSHSALVKLGERVGLRELRPGLGLSYRHQLAFESPRAFARSLLRPWVRKFLRPVPKVIFQKPGA